MLPDVTFTCREGLVPPPCPESLSALAEECRAPLNLALCQGRNTAVLPVYQWPGSPWDPLRGAYTVLRAAVDFLYAHTELRHLEIQCAGRDCLRTYQFQWNMWFAETKGNNGSESVTDL